MNALHFLTGGALVVALATVALRGGTTPVVSNDLVTVFEHTVAPGELVPLPSGRPAVVVYLDDGAVGSGAPTAAAAGRRVQRGDAVFSPAGATPLRNRGDGPLRVVITGVSTDGGTETWGTAGLAPHYRLLFENRFARVYDIRIPAGTSEPQHSHHDRIVICLSGAELRHEMPEGRKETSTLRTGEIAWRRGGTHIGHNLGKTDLWVIAIEPKPQG
jgi:quercetin dioxygenase-like cupin family protein